MEELKLAYQNSLELWEWIVENESFNKMEWPDYRKLLDIKNNCFLCEYFQPTFIESQPDSNTSCKECLIKCYNPGEETEWEIWGEETKEHTDERRHEAAIKILKKIRIGLSEIG